MTMRKSDHLTPSLFELPESDLKRLEDKTPGELQRDEGAHRVLKHSGVWRDHALAVLKRRASQPGPFNFEDIEGECGPPPNHHNAIGALMLTAVRKKIIVSVGLRKTSRTASHARKAQVYLGTEYATI
jgi:hypothetical protein